MASPAVTVGYYGRPRNGFGEDQRANGDVIHRMGDLGWIDDEGRLWFCGRKSQRVQLKEGDRFTVAVEGIFNAHPQVHRTALVGTGKKGSQTAVLFVERERELEQGMDNDTLRRELLELASKHDQARCIEHVLFHDAFPVDIRHNAKIGRAVSRSGKVEAVMSSWKDGVVLVTGGGGFIGGAIVNGTLRWAPVRSVSRLL